MLDLDFHIHLNKGEAGSVPLRICVLRCEDWCAPYVSPLIMLIWGQGELMYESLQFQQLINRYIGEGKVVITALSTTQESFHQNMRLLTDGVHLRESPFQNTKVPLVIPKINCVSMAGQASCHHKKLKWYRHDIPPPERPNMLSSMRWLTVPIHVTPSEMHPRQICLIVEFVKKFQKQVIILCLKSIMPRPPSSFDLQTFFHATRHPSLLLISPPFQRQYFMYFSAWSRNFHGTHIEGGHGGINWINQNQSPRIQKEFRNSDKMFFHSSQNRHKFLNMWPCRPQGQSKICERNWTYLTTHLGSQVQHVGLVHVN